VKTKKLFIIGNGFDIHHGILSSYADFREWLACVDPGLYEYVNRYFYPEAFWKDVEQSLADFDADRLLGDASSFLQSYGSDDWSDSGHHDYQYEIEQVVESLSVHFKERLTEWVCQLQIPVASDVNIKRVSCIDVNADFLTFNYTNTLQSLYGVPERNVLHIHSGCECAKSDLVFGHSWKPAQKKLYSEMTHERMKNKIPA
jgi:hypothetical protein